MTMVTDEFGRCIDYLRISVTDRCNLRCIYCMPEEGVASCSHGDILRFEEIERVVRVATGLGIHRIRLTGGEPLVRLGIVDLVSSLAALPGVEDLAMTTNGILLARYAEDLAEAGLQRVNVSLDTLRPERFHAMTRWGNLDAVLSGIGAALDAGLKPVKVNTVVIRGENDDEVVLLARHALEQGWHLRFIEWMPIGEVDGQHDWRTRYVTTGEIREWIESTLGGLVPAKVGGAGPARTFRLPDAPGTLGFISAVSEHFCATCNRLRLTADGKVRPCLLAADEIDLRTPLRQSASDGDIAALLRDAIRMKPQGHHLLGGATTQDRAMVQIGG